MKRLLLIALLFAVAPAHAWAAAARDIAGTWTMEYGNCGGPIQVQPPAEGRWAATLDLACGGTKRQGQYAVWADDQGGYHFVGSVTFEDGAKVTSDFILYWTRDGRALIDRDRTMHK